MRLQAGEASDARLQKKLKANELLKQISPLSVFRRTDSMHSIPGVLQCPVLEPLLPWRSQQPGHYVVGKAFILSSLFFNKSQAVSWTDLCVAVVDEDVPCAVVFQVGDLQAARVADLCRLEGGIEGLDFHHGFWVPRLGEGGQKNEMRPVKSWTAEQIHISGILQIYGDTLWPLPYKWVNLYLNIKAYSCEKTKQFIFSHFIQLNTYIWIF